MFDAVRNNPRFVQIFLALITIPFALFGVDAYFRNSGVGAGTAAKVGSQAISTLEVEQATREQESNLRAQMGESFDKAMLESPEFKSAMLDRLINERALQITVESARLRVPDTFLQQFIFQLPQFQENGKFSLRLFEALARNQGLSPTGFEEKIRVSLAQQMLLAPLIESANVPQSTAERWIALASEERVVSEWSLDAAGFASKVVLASDAAKKYYDTHTSTFQIPEQAKVEYAVLSSEEIAKQVQVTDAEIKKWYDEHLERFQVTEERRARHILVQVNKDATPEAKQAAWKKAEGLLAKVKAAPEKFEQIAKESSDDKMSGEQGGDLGYFGKGSMVKAFEDVAFSLKPKEISRIVETEFGYHIIMLVDLKPGRIKGLDEVKTEVSDEVRKQAASKRFGELADQFGNLVYEQPDALKPAADKFGLKLVQTDWLVRGTPTNSPLDHPKVQAALFSSDSVKGKRNTEAIDLGNGMVISARITDYKPAAVKDFAVIKAEVEKIVIGEEASKLAKAEGEAQLGKLKAGEAVSAAAWTAPKPAKRTSLELDEASRKAIFGADTKTLPSYVGVAKPNGYAIYRIEKVNLAKVENNDARVKEVKQGYARVLGQEDIRAFIAAARDRLGVKLSATKETSKP